MKDKYLNQEGILISDEIKDLVDNAKEKITRLTLFKYELLDETDTQKVFEYAIEINRIMKNIEYIIENYSSFR